MSWAERILCYSCEQRRYLSALFEQIQAFYGTRLCSVAVFGSMARGENKIDSDCDLLIVLENDGGRGSCVKRNREFSEIEKILRAPESECFKSGVNMELSPVILTRREAACFNPLYLDMSEAVIIITDREGALKGILNKVAAKKRFWGSRKVACGNLWYWVIKPDLEPGEKIDYEL